MKERRERVSFGGRHLAEQVVFIFFGLRLPARFHFDCEAGRATDSYSDANEVGCSQRLCDRADSEISGIASTLLNSEPARFEIELVMQHDQVFGPKSEISEQHRNARTAYIVKRLRLDQDRRLFGQRDFNRDAFEPSAAQLH